MRQKLNIVFFIFLSAFCLAQKQDYVWTFGGDGGAAPGIQGMQIDFKDSTFQVNEITIPHRNIRSHASICDVEGNLLFYTNGCAVINRNQEVMPNGDTLNHDVWKEIFNADDCDYGYPGQQDDVIIPDPSYDHGYYLFHKPLIFNGFSQGTSRELWMTYVDMNLDGGLGDVVYYDSILYDGKLLYVYLEAIPHANGSSWWITQPAVDDSIFVSFLVDEYGIHRMSDQNTHYYFNQRRSSASGTARFSPDGSLYAIYNYYDNIHLYDFDRATGKFSNHRIITAFSKPDTSLIKFGSVEWSPNSRFLYVTNEDSLIQVDLWESDPHDGIRLIDVYDGTTNPFPNVFYLQTLGPDCRIYISSTSGNYTYHVINKPNELGEACDFRQNGIQLPNPHGTANVPLFPRFRVDEEEKCNPKFSSIFGNLVYYRRGLEVYPNPVKNILTMALPARIGESELMIYDNKGKVFRQQTVASNNYELQIDLSSYACGIYHVELIPKNNPDRILYGKQIVKTE